jgi:hypothetical protein
MPNSFPGALACLAVLLFTPLRGGAQEGAATLRLTERFSTAVPDSLEVSSIAASEDGRQLLLWTATRPVLTLLRGGVLSSIGRGAVAVPAGAAFVGREGDRVEVVDAVGPSLVTLSLVDGSHVERPLAVPGTIYNAVRARDGWYVGAVDSQGSYAVYRMGSHGAVPVYRAPADSLGDGVVHGAQLSAVDDDVLITDVRPPFTSVRVDGNGKPSLSFHPAGDPAEPGRAARWFPMPVVPLGDGFLQVLTDLASDERLLVAFDRTGRVLRRSSLALPVGFVVSVPSRQLLVGSRSIDAREIVGYTWSW